MTAVVCAQVEQEDEKKNMINRAHEMMRHSPHMIMFYSRNGELLMDNIADKQVGLVCACVFVRVY